MPKILLLSTNLTPEGNVVFNLARELANAGNSVSIICPHAAGLEKNEIANGFRIERFRYFFPARFETLAQHAGMLQNVRRNPLNYALIPFFMLAFAAKAFTAARKNDLIHAHWLPAGIAALPAKYLLGKPLVVTLHGSDIRGMPKTIARFFMKRFDAVITPHDEILETAKSIAPKKIFLVRNLIDFDSFEKRPAKKEARKKLGLGENKIVSFIGRLQEFKQPLEFVKAIPFVLERMPGVKFVLVGDGPLEGQAKELAHSLGVEKNVVFAGRQSNVFDYLAASDVFVAISHIENAFSVSLVEALLCSIPCVLTKAGTTEKFFSHGKNCLLVENKNAKELAGAMAALLSSEKLSAEIGARGGELAEGLGFDKKKILNQTLSIYSNVLRGEI